MKRLVTWLRNLVAYALGLMAIDLFHLSAGPWLPKVYAPLDSDSTRLAMLLLVTSAGIIGCSIVAAVVTHPLWLNMGLFSALMVAVDISAVLGDWAPQPLWFKALIIGVIPLQVWLGARMAMMGSWRVGPTGTSTPT